MEALTLSPDKEVHCKMRCNRSLALLKGLRPQEALQEAEAAACLNPDWCKVHWRRGAALKELKRLPEAVLAFHRAWQLSKGVPDHTRVADNTVTSAAPVEHAFKDVMPLLGSHQMEHGNEN
jgi:Flp pilus assembly protein TadD